MRSHARFVPALTAAMGVAAVVMGLAALQDAASNDHGETVGSPAALPEAALGSGPIISLDVGDTSSSDVASCLVPEFAAGPTDVDVLYGQRQWTAHGDVAVLILRNQAGDLRLCDVNGGDAPSLAPIGSPSAKRPVVFVSNGRSSWSCQGTGKVLESFRTSTWLAVAPAVDTVQQRFFVDGVTGPWFTARARNGYVHLQTWLEGPQPASTRYATQYRVLGADGHDVPQRALPTGRRPLLGCPGGGSAEIG